MYKFGRKSKEQFLSCHPDIQKILSEAIKIYDFSVLEGARSTLRQAKLFKDGKSKLDGVKRKSKHQGTPSKAVDIMPYKKGTNAFSGKKKDIARFYYMMGMIKSIAAILLAEGKITHTVRFGLDWDSDDVFTDQNFDDLPHFELRKIK